MPMSLVDYSDSEQEDANEPPADNLDHHQVSRPSLKRKSVEGDDAFLQRASRGPPVLPSTFHTLYSGNARTSTTDDPSLHGGRQRQVPHIAGNWPSFVYLEWLPSDEDLANLDKVMTFATTQLQVSSDSVATDSVLRSSFRSDLGVRLPLHISLSAPLTLTTDNKVDFERDLAQDFQDSNVTSFRVMPAALKWVHNFDKTRRFLVLTLKPPDRDELQRLLTVSNHVAAKYELPQLYATRRLTAVGVPSSAANDVDVIPLTTSLSTENHDKFHISIGWTLQEPEGLENAQSHYPAALDGLNISFDQVHVKIGNRVSSIALEPNS